MAEPAPFLSAKARRTPEPAISWLMRRALDDPELISLAAGFTANEALPVAEVREIVEHRLADPDRGASDLQYGSTIGRPLLRERILDRASAQDGTDYRRLGCTSDQVIVTTGSQELLYLLSEVLLDPGDIVLIEEPTYFVYLGILDALGAVTRTIPITRSGPEPLAVDRALTAMERDGSIARLKLIYLVTYYQNPTGFSCDASSKVAIYDRVRAAAERQGRPLFIVEDAAYRDLRFAGDDSPSFLAADRNRGLVAYTNTFSKPFATGLKLGYGILPVALSGPVLRQKGNLDFGSSNFAQSIVEEALAHGAYERQVERAAARCRQKMQVMAAAIREHLPAAVRWQEPQGGLYIWATLPPGIDTGMDGTFFQACLRQKVLYVPGALCCACAPAATRPLSNSLRLSFGAATPEQIREGIRRIGQACRDQGM